MKVKLKLNGRTYKLPKRYTIKQWKAIISLDVDHPTSWPKIMSVATGQPYWKFHAVDEASLLLGASLVISSLGQRKPSKIKDLTQLTFGEFIDLDVYLVMGMDKYLDQMLELISKKDLKYIDEALWLVDQLVAFRTSTYRQYSGLFGINSKGEQEVADDANWDPQAVAKGWYKVIVDLADDKLLDLDLVTEQPLKKALNFMARRKERLLEENFKQLQNKRQHDLQRNRR